MGALSVTESAFVHEVGEVKAQEQMIYGSISHLTKLPEVKQAREENILVFLASPEKWHNDKSDIMMSGDEEHKSFTAYSKALTG